MTDHASTPPDETLTALAEGCCATPFNVLGPQRSGSGRGWLVRVWAPGGRRVQVLPRTGGATTAARVAATDLFVARFPDAADAFRYRLVVDGVEGEDPYRFPPARSDAELGRMLEPDGRVHEILGAHPLELDGVGGTAFAVWAPNARAVTLVGDFNEWHGARHPMRSRQSAGVWELFLPGVGPGAHYKYRIVGPDGGEPVFKADPCGRAMQLRPDTASVVVGPSRHEWRDDAWMDARPERRASEEPISVYEVHLGSWRREEGARPRDGLPGWKSYRELADELVPYVSELGFTHIELLPLTEHPLDESWGYQTVGYFAPTVRYGDADDLRCLVDRAHSEGIGVILDWVPAHFPRDSHGLGSFDGTSLYEHADPLKGHHPDWGTYIFDYGRKEVVCFLLSSALYWIEEFHVDGLRLDAVSSMIYLDYSRAEGEWVPNEYGGRENIEATAFLRALNQTVHASHPGVLVMAEESTAWPRVTHPVDAGGLGFDLKWNMGWMNDTLEFIQADGDDRRERYQKLSFSLTYAFSERFLLPFSHDEVVHLKRSMLGKMPGPTFDRFANLRTLYGYMWTHPGKKLLFMGSEIAVWNEWDDQGELDWDLLDEPMHAGVRGWIAALNDLYAREPALHATDFDARGFEWIDCHDADRSTIAYLRWAPEWSDFVVVVCNFGAVAWEGYRLAVPHPGRYQVLLDSSAEVFGGSGTLTSDAFEAVGEPHLARDQHIELTLPPLTALVLKPEA